MQESVELGYATTVHSAQGVTADTMHGLVTGEESRQQLYTMLTRGRTANHLYLQAVGDGDPHSLIRPETVHPSTATDLLEQILARDGAPRSAITLHRDQHDPGVRLADAAGHYVDALHLAAEDLAGRELVDALEVAAEQIVPGLIDEPAWPTLRAHLLLLAAHGTDPVAQLAAVAGRRELNSADDRAAILDWRLEDAGHRNAGQGPLPWLPGIPLRLRDHPVWGHYLTARSDLVRTLADQVGAAVADTDPGGMPVIVEGPMDAIAVTLAGGGRYIGIAPLGTSLTDEQASQLARLGKNPIVATDADIAGRVAAERDFWILTPYRLDPRYSRLPEGSDPADLLALNGPTSLTIVLDQARPLGDELINERLASLPPDQAELEAARVVAARPPRCWDPGSITISSGLNVPLHAVRRTLLAHVKEWNIDPQRAASKPLQGVNEVKRRLAEAAPIGPEQRWAALAEKLDQRLLHQEDWPAGACHAERR